MQLKSPLRFLAKQLLDQVLIQKGNFKEDIKAN